MSIIELNINSYVDLDFANAYVSKTYPSFSPEYKAWTNANLVDNDKEVILIQSTASIDTIDYLGEKKAGRAQPLQFPRSFNLMPGIAFQLFTSQTRDNTLIKGYTTGDGLELAKKAVVENAISYLLTNPTLVQDVNKRVLSGLVSKSAGSVSEAYTQGEDRHVTNLRQGIYNFDKVRAILRPWISDSVSSLL